MRIMASNPIALNPIFGRLFAFDKICLFIWAKKGRPAYAERLAISQQT